MGNWDMSEEMFLTVKRHSIMKRNKDKQKKNCNWVALLPAV